MLGKFKHFLGDLGKYKANFTQGQIWWTRISQGNLNLSLTFYSPVFNRAYVERKCVNGFHFRSLKASMVSTFGTKTCQGCLNMETIVIQMRRPLTRLGFKCGNHRCFLDTKVETIDAFGLHVSTVGVSFCQAHPQFQLQRG